MNHVSDLLLSTLFQDRIAQIEQLLRCWCDATMRRARLKSCDNLNLQWFYIPSSVKPLWRTTLRSLSSLFDCSSSPTTLNVHSTSACESC